MSDSRIILCPGQGAQVVGMGSAWARACPEARAVFDQADAILGRSLGEPISTLCFQGPADRLNRTDVAQPAILVASVACWRGLLSRWGLGEGEADLAAAGGLSLGEYTALHVAGAIAFEDALRLVALRGRAMQEAAEAVESGMVALIGADEDRALEVCESARRDGVLVCANFNAPGQVVLSGDAGACARAIEQAQKLGLRAQSLPVAGAFHSPLMEPAARRLDEALAGTDIRPPRCPVVSNVTGQPHEASAEQIRRRLVEQLGAPVRWARCMHWMASITGGSFHELAPGRTLAGLARRIDRSIKVSTHDAPE